MKTISTAGNAMTRTSSILFLLAAVAWLFSTGVARADDADNPDGPVTIGTPEWSSRLIVHDDARFIQEAPVNLLARYLRARGIGTDPKNWVRDQRLLTELLFAYDVNAYQRSDANEILRPQLLRAVHERLLAVQPQRRLRLRMHLDLGQYDATSASFELLYPQFFDSDPAEWTRGRTSAIAGDCVWSRGQKLRADTGPGFFLVLPMCREEIHRWIAANPAPLLLGEAPPAFILRPAPGTLWTRLPVALERASAFVTTHKDWRSVAAELVFDLESFKPLRFGPFGMQDPPRATWAAEAHIKPVALFVWEQVGMRTDFSWQRTPANGWRFLGSVGAAAPLAQPDDLILTYDAVTAPMPSAALPDSAPAAGAHAPDPREAVPRAKPVPVAPPATRKGGSGNPNAKKPVIPAVPVGN